MLAVTSYNPENVSEARALLAANLAAYDRVSTLIPDETLLAEIRSTWFPAMVLSLDRLFVHRLRNAEGKDGNPLNEVRMLCTAIERNAGVLTLDKTIKYRPETSITRLAIGDKVVLDRETIGSLIDAFLDEIEARFPST